MIRFAVADAVPADQVPLLEGFAFRMLSHAPTPDAPFLRWLPSGSCISAPGGATGGLIGSEPLEEAVFAVVEFHDHPELFLFAQGVSTMLLRGESGGWLYVAFPPGGELTIAPGREHYLGPSAGASALCFVVCAADAKTSIACCS